MPARPLWQQSAFHIQPRGSDQALHSDQSWKTLKYETRASRSLRHDAAVFCAASAKPGSAQCVVRSKPESTKPLYQSTS
jgi:hypothetical protein